MPHYFPYEPEQAELLPRHVRDELPAGHLCFRIHQLIEGLNLSEYDRAYGEEGQRAYNPRLMLKVWLYAFAVNVRSTRKLEKRIHEDLAFRFLAGGARPDHKTLSQFLRRHQRAVEELFAQVLGAMRQAGMVRLGRVAIDSTRIKAKCLTGSFAESGSQAGAALAAGTGERRSGPGSRAGDQRRGS